MTPPWLPALCKYPQPSVPHPQPAAEELFIHSCWPSLPVPATQDSVQSPCPTVSPRGGRSPEASARPGDCPSPLRHCPFRVLQVQVVPHGSGERVCRGEEDLDWSFGCLSIHPFVHSCSIFPTLSGDTPVVNDRDKVADEMGKLG